MLFSTTMEEESKDFIKTLLTTGIIGTDWPPKTYLITVIKNRSGEVIWKEKFKTLRKQGCFSSNGHHTERQMLDNQEFKECLEKGEVEEIILTSNYSPCKDCAGALIKFYERNKQLKLTIRFSHPYERKDGKDHLEGLKDLNRAGITLEAMTEKSWLDMLMNEEHWFDMVLKFMFDLNPGRVGERDNATRKKLAGLLRSDSEAEGIVRGMERFNLKSDSDDKSIVNGKKPK